MDPIERQTLAICLAPDGLPLLEQLTIEEIFALYEPADDPQQ